MFWNDPLRWYERGSLVVWWLGQFLFAVSFGLGFAVLYVGNFERAAVNGALGCLLLGSLVLVASRWLLALALRKRHRRGLRLY
jgi:hypothetical protein